MCLQLSICHFLSLPIGIVAASEIFHKTMEHVIETLERITVYADNIVWGSTLLECNQRLTKVI